MEFMRFKEVVPVDLDFNWRLPFRVGVHRNEVIGGQGHVKKVRSMVREEILKNEGFVSRETTEIRRSKSQWASGDEPSGYLAVYFSNLTSFEQSRVDVIRL